MTKKLSPEAVEAMLNRMDSRISAVRLVLQTYLLKLGSTSNGSAIVADLRDTALATATTLHGAGDPTRQQLLVEEVSEIFREVERPAPKAPVAGHRH